MANHTNLKENAMNIVEDKNILAGAPEPKFPRIAEHKAHWVRQARKIARHEDGREYTIEDVARTCDTTVAKATALLMWDAWNEVNPIALNPSCGDLPLHKRPRRYINGIYISVDDAEDLYYSERAEQEARAEGRTVWVGYANGGYVAPEADEVDEVNEILDWLVG